MTSQPKKSITKGKLATSNLNIPPIYFLSLEVENILCFKERQELKLSDKSGQLVQWTVILGNNGVGKTTLLRALASTEMFLNMIYSRRELINVDPSLHRVFERISIEDEVDLFNDLNINNDNREMAIRSRFIINNSLLNLKKNQQLKSKIVDIETINGDLSVSSNVKIEELRRLRGLICYSYGATRKMGETTLSEKDYSKHSESLFSDEVTLINPEEWLLQNDYAVKSSNGKIHVRLKKQFDHIIKILKEILPDIEDIRIATVDEQRDRPVAEFLTSYGWVELSRLGLGYRTTITWMVDLAVRLFKRYPESEDPLAEPAIVLVDEIDLHMHPTWQRTIMEFLTERFPNTQFIVTAHSPLVVQAAQDANIVLLRREGDQVKIINNPEIIENWRVDQVLTSVFEMPSARPAKIEPWLARRQEILTKAKLTKADKAELKELEAKIGVLPTAETTEDIKAMDIIRRAAKLLEKSGVEAVE